MTPKQRWERWRASLPSGALPVRARRVVQMSSAVVGERIAYDEENGHCKCGYLVCSQRGPCAPNEPPSAPLPALTDAWTPPAPWELMNNAGTRWDIPERVAVACDGDRWVVYRGLVLRSAHPTLAQACAAAMGLDVLPYRDLLVFKPSAEQCARLVERACELARGDRAPGRPLEPRP